MAKDKLTTKNTIFFSTANDSYVPRAATSLLSIRQFLPNARLFILSRHISQKNKKMLNRHKINYYELDLTYSFFQTWNYPIECFYIFTGPSIFKKLGFKYSVYLDGDTLCLKNPLNNCPPIKDIGGVKANSFNELFGPEKNALIEEFNIPSQLFSNHRLQSGIVYMNNVTLTKLCFLKQCEELYYRSWKKSCPRKGDDSLFALFQLVNHSKLSPTILNDSYNYMPHYKGFIVDESTVFFHFTADKPWKIHPYQHDNSLHDVYNEYTKLWRNNNKKICFYRWFNSLSMPTNINQNVKELKTNLKNLLYTMKGVTYSTQKKAENLKKPAINLYWWEPKHINNFGDIVSQELIKNIFGFKTIWAPIETCDLIATGSIIEVAKDAKREKKVYSWGSGFIRSDSGNEGLEHIKFFAIRGKKSLSRINYDVPTGDPGLLINIAYSLKKRRKSNKIGVVIHYADIKTPIAKRFCKDPRFEVISPLDSPKNVAQKISECGLILSSSLHGLIFADSLSIPNAHIKISNNLTGGTYKFIDYYSGIDKPYQPANIKKIFNDDYLNQLKNNYKPIPNLIKKQKSLIKAFPFN